ncbi:hypothetical protein HK104_005011 [Borealophlyctis nickersoniae]|nr:hypothetical protein HK104_005011 [Borealophlyctis nickersoniae]
MLRLRTTATFEPELAPPDVIPLTEPRVVIGRERIGVVKLESRRISRQHATITHCPDDPSKTSFLITDNESTNGVSVNGKKIPSQVPVTIKEGDVVVFGTRRRAKAGEEVPEEPGPTSEFRYVVKAAITLPYELFRNIVRCCHPRDGRTLRRLNKQISYIITTDDLVWGEAGWRIARNKSGWDIRDKKEDCLRWAAENGHLGVVRWCLEIGGVDVHVYDDYALRRAASNGHFDVVRLVLEKGANPRTLRGEPIKKAAEHGHLEGHLEIVRLLLDKGGNVDSAMRLAVFGGQSGSVRLLMENGAHVYVGDDGHPLWLAARNGNLEMVRLLLENGADVHARDGRALTFAATYGHTQVVRLLLEHGADMRDDALRKVICMGWMNVRELGIEGKYW